MDALQLVTALLRQLLKSHARLAAENLALRQLVFDGTGGHAPPSRDTPDVGNLTPENRVNQRPFLGSLLSPQKVRRPLNPVPYSAVLGASGCRSMPLCARLSP